MPENQNIEGFYCVYVAGSGGNGMIMLVLMNNQIAGADFLGTHFDGSYQLGSVGSGYDVVLKITAPAGITLVQGATTGPSGVVYEVKTTLPQNPESVDHIEIPTPFGPVNARFKKLDTSKNLLISRGI